MQQPYGGRGLGNMSHREKEWRQWERAWCKVSWKGKQGARARRALQALLKHFVSFLSSRRRGSYLKVFWRCALRRVGKGREWEVI